MKCTGLLIVTNLARLRATFKFSRQHVCGTLYVQLYVPAAQQPLSVPKFGELVTSVYTQSLYDCRDLDVRVIVRERPFQQLAAAVEVLMLDTAMQRLPADELARITQRFDPQSIVHVVDDDGGADGAMDIEGVVAAGPAQTYNKSQAVVAAYKDSCQPTAGIEDNVVLGGTFDRLHMGHKLLLTAAVIRARERLVVGVTDKSMVKKKTLYELIQTPEQRIAGVRHFLDSIDASLVYDVQPIADAFGPTQSDPNMQLLVVSDETKRGGELVNERRAANGLNTLAVHCIDVVELERDTELKEVKISSSNQRMDMLGTRLRPPPAQQSPIPMRPYVIAVVSSRNSKVHKVLDHLYAKGAAVVDVDLMTGVCSKNLPYRKSLDHQIRAAVRKQGGADVCFLFGTTRFETMVNESLRDGTPSEYHELWSVLMPAEEALRDYTAAERAEFLSNETMVDNSSVVLSMQWGVEYMHAQVDKAWAQLRPILDSGAN